MPDAKPMAAQLEWTARRSTTSRRMEAKIGSPRLACVVDLNAADIEAVDASALDRHLSGAMITWRRITSAVVSMQAATAMAATGKTLQEGAAFSHCAPALVRLRPRVLGETLLICFIGLPVDEAWMMLRNEDLPLGTRQVSNARLARTSGIENRLLARVLP